MFRMKVSQVVAATGATLLAGPDDACVSGIAIDSRKVEKGGVFVAFPGENVDGNRFAPQAVDSGAGLVVITADPADGLLESAEARGCAIVRAAGDDGERFMLALASAWRDKHPSWLVVGVTGSVGKTTTKDMLAHALATRFRVHATVGNFNNLIGMPITLLSAPDDAEAIVVEMGMNHPHEIDRLASVARPAVACVTNVGTSHIGLLGSRENIARAKAEICSGMEAGEAHGTKVGPLLVLTAEDDYSAFIRDGFATPAGVGCELVGGRGGVVRADGVELGEDGRPSADVVYADGWRRRVTIPVPGRQLVSDYLIALAVADACGCDRDAVVDAVAAMPATHMRLEVVGGAEKCRVIDDSYNASPSSMAAALDVLCSMSCEGRRIAVLGEIGELGDEAQRLHALIGAYAAAKPLDMLCLVGTEFVPAMREAAVTMGMSDDRIECFDTVDDAIRVMAPVLTPADLVLAKASRSVGLDLFVKGVLA